MSEQTIRFRFNAKKAAQAASRLLRLSGGQRNYMELVKLLYLADREALLKLDYPITGDRLLSLPYGPVLSHVLDLIKWGPVDETDAPWFDAVSAPFGYDVKILETADTDEDELSGAEIQILSDVFAKYGNMDWKELSRLTHKLPEWNDPDDGSIPIAVEQILRFEGRTAAEVERIRHEVAAFERIDRELSVYRMEESEPAVLQA